MSLLDGKYEVIQQRPLSEAQTLFEATAPDGRALRIVWFDLAPEQEPAFERYRRLLKRLKRDDLAALVDVTSRPGARYVVWERPAADAVAGHHPHLEAALREHGFRPEDADLRRSGRDVRLYGLAFDGAPPPVEAAPPAAAPAPAPRWSAALRRWRPSPELRAWLGSLALLLASAALLLGAFARRANDRLVTVPELAGMEVNAAAEALHRAGLAVDTAPVPSDAAAGTVVTLDPAEGTQLRPGRRVRLGYALPAGRLAPAEVPDLRGRRFPGEVEAALRGAGLELGRVARIAAEAEAGSVLAQSAAAGSRLGRGAAVDVLLSSGPPAPQTFLPDLIGLQLADAAFLAEVAGIAPDRVVVETVQPASGEAPVGSDAAGGAGRVLSQSPAPYRPISRDEAVVRLLVAAADAPAVGPAAPDLVGLGREQAEALLRADGAPPPRVEEISTLNLPPGVVAQAPAPGASLAGAMLLTVNVHPVAIPRPQVQARVKRQQLRRVPYAWSIAPGIGRVSATVYATTLEGETQRVARSQVRGGSVLQGSWLTDYPGVVTFRLELNDQPYGEVLRVP